MEPCSLSRGRIKYWSISACVSAVCRWAGVAAPWPRERCAAHRHTNVFHSAQVQRLDNTPVPSKHGGSPSSGFSTCPCGWNRSVCRCQPECGAGTGELAVGRVLEALCWDRGWSSWTVCWKENWPSSRSTALEWPGSSQPDCTFFLFQYFPGESHSQDGWGQEAPLGSGLTPCSLRAPQSRLQIRMCWFLCVKKISCWFPRAGCSAPVVKWNKCVIGTGGHREQREPGTGVHKLLYQKWNLVHFFPSMQFVQLHHIRYFPDSFTLSKIWSFCSPFTVDTQLLLTWNKILVILTGNPEME